MPGLIVKLIASEGDRVKHGQSMVIVEAMKMENEIGTPIDWVIESIRVELGKAVDKGSLMVLFKGGRG